MLTDQGKSLSSVGRRRRCSAARNVPLSPDDQGPDESGITKIAVKVNDEGRYVCYLCEKTFKTVI